MKAQIGRGKGQNGLLSYVFQGHKNSKIEKGARLIGGTCSGSTLEEIQAEFAAVRKLRPDIERPAWHCSLSLKPPERLTDKQWAQAADRYMRGMGFADKSLYAVVRHSDTEHDHIHIVASRIGIDGSLYLGKQEAKRSMPLTNEIAREFGLSELAHDARAGVKGITAGEKSMMDRTESIPTRIMLQTYIDDAARGKPSFSNFIAKLETQGVKIIPSGKTGRAQGMTFELDGVPFTGTKLGDRYKWKPLQAQLDYQPERDQPILDRLRAQAAKPETAGELTNTTINQPETANDQRKYYTHTPKPYPINIDRATPNSMRKLSECRLAHSDKGKKREGVLLIDARSDRRFTDQLRRTDSKINTGNRTLDIAFEKTENGVYKWKSRDTVAIIDHGDRISVHSKAESAVRGSLQVAKTKGWESVKATGSDEFKRQTYLIGSEMGLVIQGYEPTEADREELKQRLAAKEAKYGKNNRNTETGRSQPDRDQNRSRAGRDAGEHSHELQPDSRRLGSEDRSSAASNGGTRQQNRMAVEVQATGSAGAGHIRAPDLARDSGGADYRADIRSVVNAVGTLADLAAPVNPASTANRSSEQAGGLEQQNTSPTREHAAKIAAWEKQSEALDAEKYRITLKPRTEKDNKGRKLFDQNYGNSGRKSDREASGIAEKFWTKDEIKEEIAKLRAKNAQGYDVYITPISDSKHFIIVDDLTQASYDDMIKAGIKPAIVQNSSENNKQAIIIVDKIKGDNEQKMANEIVMRLNRKWGDPNFSGVIHPFRLAGFSNKKAGKNNYLTTLEVVIRRNCEIVSVGMQKLRDDDSIKKQEADRLKTEMSIRKETDKEFNRRLSKIDTNGQITGNAVEQAYRREVRKTVGLAKKKGWTLDWSRVDYQATTALLKQGYRSELIERAIVEASPNIEQRKGQHIHDYVRLTVQKAMVSPDVIEHKARAETQQAQRSGPKPG
ncbi:MAG: relaxase/mobilization nuclease domain-containing protein [Methylobacter sp.]|nr:relaxase/mobilization nuclease domain-containing protein [Methylobacter sp.]